MIVAAACDARFLTVAAELRKLGHPSAVVTAYGYHHLLMLSAAERLTDVIGDAEAVEMLLDSPFPPRILVAILERACIIESVGGIYVAVLAFSGLSDAKKKTWKRNNPKSYAAAASRASTRPAPTAGLQPDPEPVPVMPPSPDVPRNLFGEIVEPPEEPKKKVKIIKGPANAGQPGHSELVKYWCERWRAVEHATYPFAAKDAKHIGDLLRLSTDLDEAKGTLERYLASRDKWYAGHPLGKLINDLPKFKSGRADSGGFSSEGLRSDRKPNVADPEAVLREDPTDDE